MKQLDAKLVFELYYLIGKRLLRDVKPLGGLCYIQLVGDGDKVFEIGKIHGSPLVFDVFKYSINYMEVKIKKKGGLNFLTVKNYFLHSLLIVGF